MYRFDPSTLVQALASLPATAKVAFALACTERTARRASQELATETTDITKAARHLATQFVQGAPMEREALAALAARFGSSPALDEDITAACSHLVDCMLGDDAQSAVWTAQRAFDAADSFAQASLKFTSFTPAIESTLLGHRAVQAELAAQAGDLETLQSDSSAGPVVIARAKAPQQG